MKQDAIRNAYDHIAETYVNQRDQFRSQRFLERFVALGPPHSLILDVGCGGGVPVDSVSRELFPCMRCSILRENGMARS